MTQHRSFKRLVRARMEKTGESYTSARAALLRADQPETSAGVAVALPTSDHTIRERTGRGWEEWFDALDEQGAGDLSHRDIARRVAERLGLDPLAWNVQAVTLGYERARGHRQVGERADGFAATVTRTIGAPPERVFAAFMDSVADELRERTSTPPRSARFDAGGDERVHVTVAPKDGGRSMLSLEHARLADASAAGAVKARWRARLDVLKAELEAGGNRA